MLTFINKVVDEFMIGTNDVRVALVSFAKTPDVAIQLTSYNDKQSLQQAISNVAYSGGTGQDLVAGLNAARNVLTTSTRTPAASVAVLITEPVSYSQQLSSAVSSLSSAGIRLVSVGVVQTGQQLDSNTRTTLSYYYDMVTVADYSQLQNTVNTVVKYTCPLRGKIVVWYLRYDEFLARIRSTGCHDRFSRRRNDRL